MCSGGGRAVVRTERGRAGEVVHSAASVPPAAPLRDPWAGPPFGLPLVAPLT